MEHSIVAFTKLVGRGATLLAQLYPHLRRDIGRDVQCATVTDDDSGFGACLCQSHKTILQCQLRLQNSQLALIIEITIGCQVAPATLAVHSGHFGYGKHLETQIGEVFIDAHQSSSFASTRAASQYDSFYIIHIFINFWL